MREGRDVAIEIRRLFNEKFGREPKAIGRGPGRVDLMGGHTDYNVGFVLPIALAQHVALAAAPRDDRVLNVYAGNYDEWARADLHDLARNETVLWINYLAGVAHFLQEKGIELCGMDAVLWGDVPIAAGLSSSAATEVAAAVTFQGLTGFEMDRVEMALLCQRAENEFVGMSCGIMDQFIALLGQADHALLIDCRSLAHEAVPIPSEGYAFVICDTRVPRELVDSEYNTRRAQCEEAVKRLRAALPGIAALRDVTPERLDEHADLLPEVILKRARHVVTENARVLAVKDALERGDMVAVGRLLRESHVSLRDDYEVSIAALDLISDTAEEVEGALGGRMAGAGFGGCGVALVREEAVEAFDEALRERYRSEIAHDPGTYVCRAADGATVEVL